MMSKHSLRRWPTNASSSWQSPWWGLVLLLVGFVLGHWHANSSNEMASSVQLSQVALLSQGTTASVDPPPRTREISAPQQCVCPASLDGPDDGWRTMHLYVGSTRKEENKWSHETSFLPLLGKELQRSHVWYGQALQDEIVWFILSALDHPEFIDGNILKNDLTKTKKDGSHYYYFDVAANDARSLSNSYALELQYDWQGIRIEPNPMYWYEHTRYRSHHSHLVAAVVGNHSAPNEEIDFQYSAWHLGGIIGFDNKAETKKQGERTLDPPVKEFTMPIGNVLRRFRAPAVIDYFSLDIEGAEYYAMEKFPFDEYRFRILTIERPNQQLQTLLRSKGYVFISTASYFGEQVWLHETEHQQLLKSKAIDFVGNVTDAIKAIK
jgi:Methyltransferase FkbM domain